MTLHDHPPAPAGLSDGRSDPPGDLPGDLPDLLFAGDSRVGRDMAATDWSATPLGPSRDWPETLRSAVRILLSSRFAMWMAWGPELSFLYNDAYLRDTLQDKHPWALGRPAREVWAEIWTDIEPRIRAVLESGASTWDEDLPLIMERSGYREETFHTFSYSPLAEADGRVAGMLCVVTESTDRVLGERRLATLRDLAAALATSRTRDEVLADVRDQLARNRRDAPFALVYLFGGDPDGDAADAGGAASPDGPDDTPDGEGVARLATAVGLGPGAPGAPLVVRPGDGSWPLHRADGDGRPVLVDDLATLFPGLDAGGGERPGPIEAAVTGLTASPGQGSRGLAGVVVVGLNPQRAFDDRYRAFVELVAGQIGSGLAGAAGYESERRRAESLAALDRAKTDFFSNISHEFRTPLTLIMGPLEELRSAEHLDVGRVRAELDVVHRNALRLRRLVNNLLDFSRLQAGRLQAHFEPTDLAAVTAELAGVFRSAIERAGLEYVVDCPPLSRPFHVDRDSWEKVVLNLLSNALKFTFRGRITLGLTETATDAVLTVTDTGTGIPAGELPRLFERFHRVEGSRARSVEGSGIGLAMIRELLALHGGSIGARSEPDVGTTFRVTVPGGTAHLPPEQVAEVGRGVDVNAEGTAATHVGSALRWLPDADAEVVPPAAAAEDPTGPGSPAPAAGPAAPGGRVLVADDNADMRAYVRRVLAPHHTVELAPDGEEALARALADPPDLVVSDVMMPRLDGLGLLAALRADARTARVPVVLLSARAGSEAAVEGLAAAADDYLTKPFAADELLARVGAHLQLGRVRRSAEARFTAMADLAPALIWVADPDGSRVFHNAGWRRFTDRDPADELGEGWRSGVHPSDRARYDRVRHDAAAAGRGWQVEYRLRRGDGAYHWVLEQAVPIRLGTGTAVPAATAGVEPGTAGWIGSCTDVNARYREAERQRLLAALAAELDAEADVAGRLRCLARRFLGTHLADRVTVRGLVAGMPADDVVAVADDETAASLADPRSAHWTLCVGLAARDRVLAELVLERRGESPWYTEDDRDLIDEVAARAALAVDNALLLAEERASAERLGRLQRATTELAAAASPSQVAAVVVDHLRALVGCGARVGVFELDVAGGRLSALAVDGPPVPDDGDDDDLVGFPGGAPTASRAVSRPASPAVPVRGDVPEGQALRTIMGPWGGAYPEVLALVAAGRTVGAIGVAPPDGRALSAEERRTLAALAEPCAMALDRARLYRSEHRIAETLQHSLLPQRLPALDRLLLAVRYLPGAEGTRAGGDWYDVVALDEDRVAVAVGDVVGQGTVAAAVMGQLRTALSGYLLAGHPPAEALDLLDRLSARVPGARASTAVCLVVDTAAQTVRWARAGHLPVLVVDDDGVRFLDGSAGHGPLLGIGRGRPPYTEGLIELSPGASLVLYTDGLVERRSESLDEGLERLALTAAGHAGAAPEALASFLEHELAEHDGRADDVAVVVARLAPPPLHRTRPAVPEELTATRRAVAAWARAAALCPDQLEDLQLAVGEGASNVLEHAYRDREVPGVIDVRLARRADGGVAVRIGDEGSWRPVPADPGYRGRGLAMIRALARDVTVDIRPDGTTVTFVVAPPGAPAEVRAELAAPVAPAAPTVASAGPAG